MAPTKQDRSPKSLRKKFQKLLNTTNEQGSQAYTDKSVTLGMVNEYSSNELRRLTQRQYVTQQNQNSRTITDFPELLNSTYGPHREIVNNIADAERLKALDPNIKRIEQIVVSSIMSPNDLQDVDPDIIIDNDQIDEGHREKISELLSGFYCNTYKLREKMTAAVKEAHFRSGAGVSMLLPEATLTELINTYDPQRAYLRKCGKEQLIVKLDEKKLSIEETTALKNAIFSPDFFRHLLFTKRYSSIDPSFGYTHGKEEKKNNIQVNLRNPSKEEQLTLAQWLNSISPSIKYTPDRVIDEDPPMFKMDEQQRTNLKKSFESMTINFTKALVGEDSQTGPVAISENPEILRFGKSFRKHQTNKLNDRIGSSISPIFAHLLDQESPNTEQLAYSNVPIMDLTSHMTDFSMQQAFPFYMDLPTESVIPVCVPGSRNEHLGYFILVDAYGQPIEASAYLVDSTGNGISGRISTAYNAMYGEMPTESGIRGGGGFNTMTQRNKEYRQNNITKVFNYVLDEMLKRKLNDIGLNDVTLSGYTTIAQCMLYRLLEKKQTALVFVPKKYITYLAFDYHRETGTGKSKIEDIMYMESLKVSFLTANTLATMKSAVPVKKVKINLDKSQVNSMQAMLIVRDALVQREKFSPSTFPASVTTQILTQNMSVESAHPESDFSMTVEDTHREIPRADTDFLKELDNSTIIGLGVAPSALSESSEVQFARSLATTNLHFAKGIRQDQVIVEDTYSTHLQHHASLSSVLIYKIANIIDNSMSKQLTEKKKATKDLTEIKPSTDNKLTGVGVISNTISKDTFNKVMKIIANIRVKLCPPDVAPDDTQYNILSDVLKRISEYVDVVYPDDYSNFGDDKITNHYRLVKAHVKSIMAREAANHLGFRGLLSKIPELDDYALEETSNLTNIYSVIKGLSEAITREVQSKQKKAPEGSTEATDGDSSSSSDKSFW